MCRAGVRLESHHFVRTSNASARQVELKFLASQRKSSSKEYRVLCTHLLTYLSRLDVHWIYNGNQLLLDFLFADLSTVHLMDLIIDI